MSTIISVIAKVLEIGCGIKLSDVRQTGRYQQLERRVKRLPYYYPKSSDQGIALRSSHFTMGQLLNLFSESEALKKAQMSKPLFPSNRQLWPLIWFTGEKIIETAGRCLTDEIQELAKRWQTGNTADQIAIAEELTFILRSTSQEADSDWNITALAKEILMRQRERLNNPNCYLPQLYGRWNKDENSANCQGKLQMVLAFAKLAGARTIAVRPIRSKRIAIHQGCRAIESEIIHEMDKRNLHGSDKAFDDAVQASRYEMIIGLEPSDTFHTAAALQLNNRRWVLIDPHVVCWGVLNQSYNLPKITRLLKKYQLVLPGLAIMGHDQGLAEEIVTQAMTIARKYIQLSRNLEQALMPMALKQDINGIITFLANSDDWIRMTVIENNDNTQFSEEHIQKILNSYDLRNILAMQIFIGMDMFNPWKLMSDPDFVIQRVKTTLTWPLCCAANHIKIGTDHRTDFAHPVCEFSNPIFSVAIGAINSMDIDMAPYQTDRQTRQFFIQHSYDQISLYNACLQDSDKNLKQAATIALEQAPFNHPRCQKRIDYLKGSGNE